MTENMELVIAYDGSECADVALDDLRNAGLPAVAQGVVVSVAELPASQASGLLTTRQIAAERTAAGTKPAVSPILEETQTMALKAADKIRKMFPSWDVSTDIKIGSPALCILERAAALKADLIVVGSHGRNALSRLILGSVSQKIVTEARCSVRVVHSHPEEDDHPARIIIGLDGSRSAGAAVRGVASRAWPPGSKALLIAAYEPVLPTAVGQFIPPALEVVGEFDEQERKWLENRLEAQASLLRAAGLEVSQRIKIGDPKHVLLEEAEEWGADTIVVGARGLGRIGRLLLGSVSTAVVSRAHCTVEVVRPPIS